MVAWSRTKCFVWRLYTNLYDGYIDGKTEIYLPNLWWKMNRTQSTNPLILQPDARLSAGKFTTDTKFNEVTKIILLIWNYFLVSWLYMRKHMYAYLNLWFAGYASQIYECVKFANPRLLYIVPKTPQKVIFMLRDIWNCLLAPTVPNNVIYTF